MELIAIGKISRPVGNRGEIKILPLTDDTQRFADLRSVWVGKDENSAGLLKISAVRIDKSQVVISLNDVGNIDAAEQLRGKYLFVPKDEVVELRDGRFFVDDVLGCEVVTEEKMRVGIVSDLLSLPANDVWVVTNGTKEILIPAVKDIIKQVDVKEKRIIVHALEGLFD